MYLGVPLLVIATCLNAVLPALGLAYPPKPSAYPPHPAPKPKFCPTALVCCDSFKSPYESDASRLIDLLKVELTAEEKALGVGLTCDAIVGLQKEERKRELKRREFHFGWWKGKNVDEEADKELDEEEPDEEEPDEEVVDEDEKDFAKRGVDVCAKVSLCCDKAYSSGLLAIGCIEVSID